METILWYFAITGDYLFYMMPSMLVAVAVFLMLIPLRKQRLAKMGLESGCWREVALLLFVVFSAGLAALTLTPANFWSTVLSGQPQVFPHFLDNRINFIPTIFRDLGSGGGFWSFYMLLGNLVVFVPFGIFPALLWGKYTWKRALNTGFGISFAVELIQFFIGRSSDINDLILNTLGTMVGFGLYLALKRLFPQVATKFICKKVEVPHGR